MDKFRLYRSEIDSLEPKSFTSVQIGSENCPIYNYNAFFGSENKYNLTILASLLSQKYKEKLYKVL